MFFKPFEQVQLKQGLALSTIALKWLLELIHWCQFLGLNELRFKYVITDAPVLRIRLWDRPNLHNQGI